MPRDWDNNVLAFGAKRLNDDSNNEAKNQVALLAIGMAKRMLVMKLHLEGDSQIIINAIMVGKCPTWNLNKIVKIIRNLLFSFKDFKTFRMLRNGNRVVYKLSKWAVSLMEDQAEFY